MEHRQLGRTGLTVSVLGFGGAEIGFQHADRATVDRLLGAAIDGGLNVVDTAECYGSSEELIGHALAGRRDAVHLFTKCGHAGEGDALPSWHPDLLLRQLDRSLEALGTDHLDLWQLHSCDESRLRQGDVVTILQEAKAAGKTRFIGYSGDNEAAVFAAECGAFDVLQTSVNIADQHAIDNAIPKAVAQGMGVIAKRPLANVAWWNAPDPPGAEYAQPYWDRLQTLNYEFQQRLGREEIVGIAMRFALTVPGVAVALIGTQNPNRWVQNSLMAASGNLPASDHDPIRARWHAVAGDDWVSLT